jgi:hypothetical protein
LQQHHREHPALVGAHGPPAEEAATKLAATLDIDVAESLFKLAGRDDAGRAVSDWIVL